MAPAQKLGNNLLPQGGKRGEEKGGREEKRGGEKKRFSNCARGARAASAIAEVVSSY